MGTLHDAPHLHRSLQPWYQLAILIHGASGDCVRTCGRCFYKFTYTLRGVPPQSQRALKHHLPAHENLKIWPILGGLMREQVHRLCSLKELVWHLLTTETPVPNLFYEVPICLSLD